MIIDINLKKRIQTTKTIQINSNINLNNNRNISNNNNPRTQIKKLKFFKISNN